MKSETCKNLLLLIIAIALVAIAARSYTQPPPAEAQVAPAYPFLLEPGTQMLRQPDGSGQIYGRVAIDLRTGKVWGFPTYTLDTYPSNPLEGKPVTSHPFLLGKFAFDETMK